MTLKEGSSRLSINQASTVAKYSIIKAFINMNDMKNQDSTLLNSLRYKSAMQSYRRVSLFPIFTVSSCSSIWEKFLTYLPLR
jgi:hypothetical protein